MSSTTVSDELDLTPDELRELEAYDARHRDRRLAWLLVVAGAVGFVAAVTLLLERIQLLIDPSYVPSCSINPILSCGSVMTTEQARVFGFPNPVIGVAAFPVLLAVGAGILAGARYAAWFWRGLQLGVVLGAVFVGWLVWQSVYEIGALCPYCMVVWAVVIPLFWAVTRRNVDAGVLGAGLRDSAVGRALRSWSVLATALTYLLVIAVVLVEFWDYWSTLV
ncbi:vitamin K epoxide reductase family protein [Nocardioides zeae]|uniref:Vitamin K epoxide reductase family protein n=1 Tax=Nocardioides imazamoxiresistens TaxID=3231893 RepID=A0ABU3PVQ9_9ACTN|nr:vitamin K epoxide reductase family protein [Nocardioides zeae]MDT9593296.1 vitamin K epoxide reductase family protein [Nocardioides zeae]